MSSRHAVADVLRAAGAAMTARRVRWYLFGAQAAMLWGSPRLSVDVDITVAVDEAAIDELVAEMQKHGFDERLDDPDFVARYRVVPLVHRRTGIGLDLVVAGRGLEEEFLDRAKSVDVDGTVVPVISPEDLVVTKILAGRPKDVEDARSVIAARRTTMDVERVRTLLGLLEAMLTRGDLLPVFEDAWRASANPTTPGPPRG